MLSLSMSCLQAPTQELQCVLCLRSMNDHGPTCSQALCEYWDKQRQHLSCPCCYKNEVDLNTDDFYECRACRTQFTTSHIAAGEDPATLQHSYLFDRSDQAIDVLILTRKGHGKIKSDLKLAQAMRQRTIASRLLKRKGHSE